MVLGLVTGAHGLRGEIRIRYFGDGPEGLARMPAVWIGRTQDDPEPRCYELERVAGGRAGEVRVALSGVEDRDGAEALHGRTVMGETRHLEPLPRGQYRWHELLGCRVEDLEGRPVGTVREIWETGAHDVLVVEDEEGQRHLLPAAGAFLREVDPPGRRIVYEVIPGLLDPPG